MSKAHQYGYWYPYKGYEHPWLMFGALSPETSSAAEGHTPPVRDWFRNSLETRLSFLTPKLLNAASRYLFPQDFPVDIVSEHGGSGEKS